MSLFTSFVNVAKTIINGIKNNMSITDLIVQAISYIPNLVNEIKELISNSSDGLSKEEIKQIIDDGLEGFDNATGKEGLTVINSMAKGHEEQTLDLLRYVFRNALYDKFDIEIPEEDILIPYNR